MSIASDSQNLAVGEYVELFQMDATALGGSIYSFVQAAFETAPVIWGGQTYTPIDIKGEGFEVSGQGTLPRPTLTVSNVKQALASAVISWDGLLGAIIKRYRTLRKYLDGQPEADPNACWGPDIFKIERKLEHNKFFLRWELSALIDAEGQKLPRRQVLRDFCSHVYRRYKPETDSFDYSKATCPYVAAVYYDELGKSCAKANDQCGKRITDCRLRFLGTTPLPTTAFPGVGRTRI